jgi:hypothetical protein
MKNDKKLLIKEFVFKKGLDWSNTKGPIDHALKISNAVKVISPNCKMDQIIIESIIQGLYFTILAAIWNNLLETKIYCLYSGFK